MHTCHVMMLPAGSEQLKRISRLAKTSEIIWLSPKPIPEDRHSSLYDALFITTMETVGLINIPKHEEAMVEQPQVSPGIIISIELHHSLRVPELAGQHLPRQVAIGLYWQGCSKCPCCQPQPRQVSLADCLL